MMGETIHRRMDYRGALYSVLHGGTGMNLTFLVFL